MYVIVGEENSNNDKFGVFCGFNSWAATWSEDETHTFDFESDFETEKEIRPNIFYSRQFALDEIELIREKIDIPMKIVPLGEWLDTIKNRQR